MLLERTKVCTYTKETALSAVENSVVGRLTAGITSFKSRVESFGKTHIDRQFVVLDFPIVGSRHDDRRSDIQLQLCAAVDRVSFGFGVSIGEGQKTKDKGQYVT